MMTAEEIKTEAAVGRETGQEEKDTRDLQVGEFYTLLSYRALKPFFPLKDCEFILLRAWAKWRRGSCPLCTRCLCHHVRPHPKSLQAHTLYS
jgi:hypothetical protein